MLIPDEAAAVDVAALDGADVVEEKVWTDDAAELLRRLGT